MKTLLIDNHDSFTFNLFHLLGEVTGEEPTVVRNDQLSWEELDALDVDNIVISPGPGRPDREADFGVCARVLAEGRVPVLGVCLGHQGLGHVSGGRITLAPEPMHGRLSLVHHDGAPLFRGLPSPFQVVRYHSLLLDPDLPACLEPIAWTSDGLLMAVAHRERPLWGVQFHPESICSERGHALLRNFCDLTRRYLDGPGGRAARSGRRDGRSAAAVRSVSILPRAPLTAAEPSGYRVLHRKLDLHPDAERLYVTLFAGAERSFWLDSSRVEQGLARFSYMGAAGGPHGMEISYRTRTKTLTITDPSGTHEQEESLFTFLRRELLRRRVAAGELPFDFNGGFVGYLGYELKAECGAGDAHLAPWPDARLLLADRLLVLDHEERATYLVCVCPAGAEAEAEAWLEAEGARVRESLGPPLPPPPPQGGGARYRLDRDRATYLRDIAACLEALRQGESYEICLTNQIDAEVSLDPVAYYRTLRRLNPAPYAALLRFGELAVACSSPERFLRVERDGWVESRPIKGTLPRGETGEEDAALRERLRTSEKARAENLMIVDLVRNDLGVVCGLGTVHVPRLMEVETYATVHHLVSTIRGRLRPDMTAVDCVRAAFPGGSMTGAPKQRTLRLLDGLEGRARGVYSGTIGFFALSGAADLNIVIRTAVLSPTGATVGTGGAIVALSEPRAEFEEIVLKAQALLRSFELARSGELGPAPRLDGAAEAARPGTAFTDCADRTPRPSAAPRLESCRPRAPTG